MSRQQMLLLGIVVSLVVFFLVGCGSGAPTAISEAPAATSALEQAAATSEPPTATSVPPTATPIPPTPTPEPPTATSTPVPPTPTSTPVISNPQPGSTFSGSVEIGEKAASTTISFTISDDGASITLLELKIIGPFECSDASAGEGTESAQNVEGPLSITEGKFEASLFGGGKVEGQFISSTEVSGTINMALYYLGRTCDWGTFDWSAKSSASTSEQSSSEATTGQVKGILIDQDPQQPIGEVSTFQFQ